MPFCQKMPSLDLFAIFAIFLPDSFVRQQFCLSRWNFWHAWLKIWIISLVCFHIFAFTTIGWNICTRRNTKEHRSSSPQGEHLGHGAKVPYSCLFACCSVTLLLGWEIMHCFCILHRMLPCFLVLLFVWRAVFASESSLWYSDHQDQLGHFFSSKLNLQHICCSIITELQLIFLDGKMDIFFCLFVSSEIKKKKLCEREWNFLTDKKRMRLDRGKPFLDPYNLHWFQGALF